jgi:rhodanese-related sulfurtransferase
LKSALTGTRPPIVIDVRRTPAFRAASDMIEGALRRDPDAVSSWGRQLPRAARFVVYCVHGHEVSQTTAKALRDLARDAQFLEGGLNEGWRADGGALMEKPEAGPNNAGLPASAPR